jgi:serine protease Do
LSIGKNTSSHIEDLAKALVAITLPGKPSRTIYGLAISPDGYILVPANMVGKYQSFTVAATGNPPLQAKFVAEDPSTDTAVIKVSNPLSAYVSGTSQRTANSGDMTIGIGPNSTVSKPDLVISQVQQTGMDQILSGGLTANDTYLADPANTLNPEGLLFVNSRGNPIGIGLGAIKNKWVIAPLSTMLAAAQKIELANGVPQGWLGIVGLSATKAPPASKIEDGKGVIVYSVVTNSPAKKAGIQPNDEIVALDNEPVASLQQLQTMLSKFPAGTQVTLTILRQNQTLNDSIQLGTKSPG